MILLIILLILWIIYIAEDINLTNVAIKGESNLEIIYFIKFINKDSPLTNYVYNNRYYPIYPILSQSFKKDTKWCKNYKLLTYNEVKYKHILHFLIFKLCQKKN